MMADLIKINEVTEGFDDEIICLKAVATNIHVGGTDLNKCNYFDLKGNIGMIKMFADNKFSRKKKKVA